MSTQRIVLALSFVLFFANLEGALPSGMQDDPDIVCVMQEHGVQGTMIIASQDDQVVYLCDSERAHTPLSPASTFKIPNSMIAIEEGVLADQYEVIPWDGQKRLREAWNQDHHLKSAFRVSCVWFYQELAKRIERDNYLKYFEILDYGNRQIGEDITTFWLVEGDLRITPLEQIDFLRSVYNRKFPLSARTYDILQDIMLEEEGADYKLYSKTGAATRNWVGHTWYVGYVTTENKVWFFVTNIVIDNIEDLPKRKEVTLAALRKKGII